MNCPFEEKMDLPTSKFMSSEESQPLLPVTGVDVTQPKLCPCDEKKSETSESGESGEKESLFNRFIDFFKKMAGKEDLYKAI